MEGQGGVDGVECFGDDGGWVLPGRRLCKARNHQRGSAHMIPERKERKTERQTDKQKHRRKNERPSEGNIRAKETDMMKHLSTRIILAY